MKSILHFTNLFLNQYDIMKKYSNIYIIGLAMALVGLTSCNDFTDSLSDLNKNPNAYEEVIPEFLFTNSTLKLEVRVINISMKVPQEVIGLFTIPLLLTMSE